jgi:hypothetical protein
MRIAFIPSMVARRRSVLVSLGKELGALYPPTLYTENFYLSNLSLLRKTQMTMSATTGRDADGITLLLS